jgi:hypothetical protein
MRILSQLSQVSTIIDKQNKYLCGIVTNDARCTLTIKSRIAMEQGTFNKIKTFHQQIGLKFQEETSKELHFEHSFVWC